MDPTTPTPTAQATSTTEPAEQTVQIHNSNINHPLQPTPNGPTSAEDGQRPVHLVSAGIALASPPGSSMSAKEQSSINPASGTTDQIGHPNRPWSQSPPPGSRGGQAFSLHPPGSSAAAGRGPSGEIDMHDGERLSVPAAVGGYDGRRHSIASGEIVQGQHHNGHSHSTHNSRAGPPSNAAHLLSPYHDQYTAQAAQHRQALKRKLSHDHISAVETSSNGQVGTAMDVDSGKPGSNQTSQYPNKRRGSAIDAARLPQMNLPDHDNSANPSSPAASAPNIWPGGPPRWGSSPYTPGSAGTHPAPPPAHITDERRDSAASIFSATSMASSASGGPGYTPSTAPTSFSSNGGSEDPNRNNYQAFVWPPPGGSASHGYNGPGAPYFGPPPNAQFPGGSAPAKDRHNSMSANDDTPPPGTTTPDHTNPGPGEDGGDPTPTSASAPSIVGKDTPYSRSPELRVSHKLAERKRRKEMKDLFDELRDQLPADRGMKASKWEILSKAVEYIVSMKGVIQDQQRQVEQLRHEVDLMRTAVPGAPAPPPPGQHMHSGPRHHT